jgi:hypothetical protein
LINNVSLHRPKTVLRLNYNDSPKRHRKVDELFLNPKMASQSPSEVSKLLDT